MLIQINDLTKTYQRHTGIINAVDHLSLEISQGSFVSISGPSGSGKSTLLMLIGGLLRPTSGTMFYNGKELDLYNDNAMADFRTRHVGFVMQSFALIPYLTAVENVMVALQIQSNDKKQNLQRALELLSWVGLEERTNHFPKELSAGQQQRVAIARALANKPDLILADEPTGNLDPQLALDILSILKSINQEQKTTILMVTHSPEAADFGGIKITLKQGRIQE